MKRTGRQINKRTIGMLVVSIQEVPAGADRVEYWCFAQRKGWGPESWARLKIRGTEVWDSRLGAAWSVLAWLENPSL